MPEWRNIERPHAAAACCISCLLVDDDAFSRMMVLRAIEKTRLDMTLETATSLSEAREKLMSGYYDLVLLDHHLPDGFGAGFLVEMSEGGVPRWTRAAILTGLREHAEQELGGARPDLQVVDKSEFGPEFLEDVAQSCCAA
ncbi:response regulator [Mangrovicoccus sp. HB161399]|uniref:response regulator n=1 Tax=Mangrovicoccus sp. HB161399 TaxID=2720392 RepID=UPI0015536425|nr:response regulator [Mangrovicoccus sp. HB161399]